ncbi:DUF4190 domain-containing protein [Clavibacter tessellarius]|uniref:DUF4190 domain-containing protein n=1 Tax=Clavibacter tessellarius TaxID=31965 RepID=A0A225CCV9_9MICO|nr:DUF4190 domain-containing protein [Clavibacter michiganensis]OQJ62571.1 hypothetical protein B5P24_05920 [Clavibacter michiganensis subsp. tessellarius]UKF34440.1 DUF4190 domain-containing protein [Clavibacter michiganensis subsp. tessellarius]
MTFRYAPEPEPTAPRERKTSNGVGLAALIVGVVSLVGSVIPILNYVSGFLAVVGIVLGIIGLILRDRPRGMALGGLVLSAIALILSIVLAIVYTVGIATVIGDAVEDSREQARTAEPADPATPAPGATGGITVDYELTGTVPSALATWSSVSTDDIGYESATAQGLPFTRGTVLPDDVTPRDGGLTLSGMADAADGDLTCRISVRGVVVEERTATGPQASVVCLADVDEIRAAAAG